MAELRALKLRFVHRHARLELVGSEAGVDLVDDRAAALFALAGPLLAEVAAVAPGRDVRALSVDLEAPRLIASLADAEVGPVGAPPAEGAEHAPKLCDGSAADPRRAPAAAPPPPPPRAVRVEGESLQAALEAAGPLIAAAKAAVDQALEARAARGGIVGTSASAAKIGDLSLLLTAVGIPNHVEAPAATGETFSLQAPDDRRDDARDAIAAYEAENVPIPAVPEAPDYGETLVGAAFALLLLGWFAAIDFLPRAADWSQRGAAEASRIVAGEWWRTATALTLHADAAHVGGNAALGGIALTALARRLGPAAAAWVALAAGVAGNALTAAAHRSGFVSVGASTAVFGLLGALAASLAVGTRPRSAGDAPPLRSSHRRRSFLAVPVSAALLGLLGAGERADLLAHLFGMASGLAFGALAAWAIREPPRRTPLQPLGAAAVLIALAACWARAI